MPGRRTGAAAHDAYFLGEGADVLRSLQREKSFVAVLLVSAALVLAVGCNDDEDEMTNETPTGPSGVVGDPQSQFGWSCGGTYRNDEPSNATPGIKCGLQELTLRGEPGVVVVNGLPGSEKVFTVTQNDIAQASDLQILGDPTNRCSILCTDTGSSVTLECFNQFNGKCIQAFVLTN